MESTTYLAKRNGPGHRILLPIALAAASVCFTLQTCRSPSSGDGTKTAGGTKTEGKSATSGGNGGEKTAGQADANSKADSNKGGSKTGGTDPDGTITAEMRQNGFVTPASYQVFVTAFGSSESEARENGLADGRRKALSLLRTDPALRGKALSPESAEELRRVIQGSSRIVRLQREPNGSWSVVILVEKEGLRAFLRRLR